MVNHSRPLSVPEFVALKQAGRKITMLTAYDYPTARALDEAGVDSLLVGDTLGMVVQGRENTLGVRLEDIIYHAEMVSRAAQHALVVADMPFLSYQVSVPEAIANAGRILKETRCQAIKLEGGADQAATISALVGAGIPVMAHVGLRPQNVHQMGGYKVQRDAERLMNDATAAEQAGAFSIVLECIPRELARQITDRLSIPTIGIGAGADCDGQVLVTHDMLGLTSGHVPKFVKQYADLQTIIGDAARQYCQEVRDATFPAEEHGFR
ncbi:MAG: 3-methyl-2-oxobutanoate hydroxymethyltransferase [Planctomycetales bacterium]|nr:3-methyl-2-oxobutanoate hydroxymethyltransferase [Planctomycetales bacterium]MCA9202452.1 3-methyl-2-oxobutanoate hydroxymethyltransferase [Planctomycetales bacterium]